MNLEFRKELRDLVPYKPGKPISDVKREFGLSDVIKLASNENPLGTSQKAKDAIIDALDSLHIYPDGNCTDLKSEIAQTYGLLPSQVLPSSGSDEMVDQLAKTFICDGDEIIMASVTFPRYKSTAIMMGGIPVVVPMKDFTHDLDAMMEAITEKTKMIWICNPNNPTGTMIPTHQIVKLLEMVPENIVVALDEAYREYVTRDDYMMDSEKLLERHNNLVILRTFSKAYGLCALRVGYTLANIDIIKEINKVRGPFNVNTLAQVAAIAALKDHDFIKKSYDLNVKGKDYYYKEFDKLNIEYYNSETNHIFLDVNEDAFEVFEKMQSRGVIIRPIFDTYIRISIGTMEENKRCIEVLSKVLKEMAFSHV